MQRSVDALLRELPVDQPVEHIQLELWPKRDVRAPVPYDPLKNFGPPIAIHAEGIEECEEEASTSGARLQCWPVNGLTEQSQAIVQDVVGCVSNSIGFAALQWLEDDLKCAMHWAVKYFAEERGGFRDGPLLPFESQRRNGVPEFLAHVVWIVLHVR